MELSKIILRIVMLLLVVAAILFAVRFCDNNLTRIGKSKAGDGNVIRREMHVEAPFTAIRVSGSVNVFYRQDATSKIEIVVDSNLLEYIEIEIDEETLEIRQKMNLRFTTPVKLLVSAPDLRKITVDGAAEVHIPDTLYTDHFTLDIRGAGMAKLLLDCNQLSTVISGAGEIQAKGRADRAISQINGAGKLTATRLITKTHKITMSGAGSAYITAIDSLDATINGAGLIEYHGNPVINQDINGVGKIRPAL
ncbi:MAG: head GIN domain-containing protein [Bacteroidales bacterium]